MAVTPKMLFGMHLLVLCRP